MCGESGRGTQTRLSVPSEFTSSRENPVELGATTSFVTRAVKLVRSIPTQVLHVLNLATHREEVCRCESRSMHYESGDWMKGFAIGEKSPSTQDKSRCGSGVEKTKPSP
jgi:hypothetical protein